jgi:hypothetical protein
VSSRVVLLLMKTTIVAAASQVVHMNFILTVSSQNKPFSVSLIYRQLMNPGNEHGVLALEFEEEEEQEEDETMVKPKRPSEGGGGRFRAVLAAVIVSLLLIVGVSVTSKARPIQPALRSAVVDNASDLVLSDNGSRTFEFVLTTLEGLEGKSGTVVIKTMPEWAPLGAKQFHVS